MTSLSKNGTGQLAAGFVGDTLLRMICQTIFVPIDDDVSSPEQREKAYKSFHVLADYLEHKGINGIIYPSTRTKLVGKHTQNIVHFCVDDFSPIPGTLLEDSLSKEEHEVPLKGVKQSVHRGLNKVKASVF